MAKAKLGSGARFKELKDTVARYYISKGKSPKEAAAIGAGVAAKQGMKKYGKKRMQAMARAGKKRK